MVLENQQWIRSIVVRVFSLNINEPLYTKDRMNMTSFEIKES